MEKLQLLSKGDNGSIWKVEVNHQIMAYKEIYAGNPQLRLHGVRESYHYAIDLPENDHLVKVFNVAFEDDKVCVLMEYLDGWKTIDGGRFDKMKPAIRFMIKNGVIDWDLSPRNFMEKNGKVKMIDLDRLVQLSDLPGCPSEPNWILTWFGSRMIHLLNIV